MSKFLESLYKQAVIEVENSFAEFCLDPDVSSSINIYNKLTGGDIFESVPKGLSEVKSKHAKALQINFNKHIANLPSYKKWNEAKAVEKAYKENINHFDDHDNQNDSFEEAILINSDDRTKDMAYEESPQITEEEIKPTEFVKQALHLEAVSTGALPADITPINVDENSFGTSDLNNDLSEGVAFVNITESEARNFEGRKTLVATENVEAKPVHRDEKKFIPKNEDEEESSMKADMDKYRKALEEQNKREREESDSMKEQASTSEFAKTDNEEDNEGDDEGKEVVEEIVQERYFNGVKVSLQEYERLKKEQDEALKNGQVPSYHLNEDSENDETDENKSEKVDESEEDGEPHQFSMLDISDLPTPEDVSLDNAVPLDAFPEISDNEKTNNESEDSEIPGIIDEPDFDEIQDFSGEPDFGDEPDFGEESGISDEPDFGGETNLNDEPNFGEESSSEELPSPVDALFDDMDKKDSDDENSISEDDLETTSNQQDQSCLNDMANFEGVFTNGQESSDDILKETAKNNPLFKEIERKKTF